MVFALLPDAWELHYGQRGFTGGPTSLAKVPGISCERWVDGREERKLDDSVGLAGGVNCRSRICSMWIKIAS